MTAGFQTISSDLILHPCHQNLITQIFELGTVMIKYRVQYVEKCNQKQRFWFICSENIKSILRRRNLDVKFVVECLALNENCKIIPTLILEQDLICADFVGKILELVVLVGIMKNLALKLETNKTKRLKFHLNHLIGIILTQLYFNIFSKIPENS